jgi:hypothetical protein
MEDDVQKWEYLEVYAAGTLEWLDSAGREGKLEHRNQSWWIANVLNERGQEGWELVATVGSDAKFYRCFLKRPKGT